MNSDFLRTLADLDLPPELREQLAALLSKPLPHRDALLSRLSLPRTFKENVYAAAARTLEPPAAPSFEQFTALPEVQALIGYPGRFTIDEKVRGQNLRAGIARRDEWRSWGLECVRILDPADEIESMDRLQLLFFADPGQGLAELQKAFERAGEANDIPRLGALVQLIASVVPLVHDQKIEAQFRDLQARYRSRSLFYTEFLQTADFFPRTEMERKLTAFVESKDSQNWVFQLHATGGMGKTMVLRRMISWGWVVGPARYPCAWIDFDYLDVQSILRAPWLLTLPIAAQWNEQLEWPVFGGVLNPSMQPLADLLFRARADGSARGLSVATADNLARAQYRAGRSNPMRCGMLAGAIPPASCDARAQLMLSARTQQFIWDSKFPEAIAALPPDRPALLFLDTLEEASLQHSAELRDTLLLIRDLRDKVRELSTKNGKPVEIKLILSGRHELGSERHVPEFPADFRDQYTVNPLQGFEAPEATAFLQERLPKRQRHLIPAMVSKSEGVPFNLSLFAEWAAEEPELEEKTVLRSEQISTVMLIERIVKRIPHQPLRWIIRYGSVPRTLTIDFLEHVMQQPLIDALSGKAKREGLDTPGSRLEQDVWSEEIDFQFDARTLWQQHVLRYASAKGWMEPAGDAVRFRSDIQNPMRLLLRRQRIFRDLHRAAADWFDGQSRDTKQWLPAKIERLYHRLQLRGVEGEQVGELATELRGILDSPLLEWDAALRKETATTLLSPEFSNWETDERVFLEYRLAEGTAAEKGYRYVTDPDAKRSILKVFETAGTAFQTALPPFAFAWKQGADGESVSVLFEHMHRLAGDNLIQLAMLIAEMSGLGSSMAATALRLVLEMQGRVIPPGCVAERLAEYYRATSPADAVPHYKTAAAEFAGRGDVAKQSELLATAAGIEISLGRLSQAERILQPLRATGSRTAGVAVQLARVELSKGQPGMALDILGGLDASRMDEPARIETAMLHAEALTQRVLWAEAQEQWERARLAASKASNAPAVIRCVLGLVRLYVWWLRRTDRAAILSILEHTTLSSSDRPSAEVDVWRIALSDDLETLRRGASAELRESSPAARVRLILALSRVGLPESRWRELLQLVEQVPASARIILLMEPVLMGNPPADLQPELRRSIAEAFRHAPEGEVEAAWHAIRYGELLAWLGFHEEAADLLARNVPPIQVQGVIDAWGAATYRERRRVEQRIRDWGGKVDPEPDPPDAWWTLWPHTPFRRAAVLVENAQRAFDAGKFEIATQCLGLAAPVLQETPFETVFHQLSRRLQQGTGNVKFEGGSSVKFSATVAPDFQVLCLRPQSGRVSARWQGKETIISSDTKVQEVLVRARGIPRRLVQLPPDELSADLRMLLEQAIGGSFSGSGRIGLRMPLGALSATPWEIAFPGPTPPFRTPSGIDEYKLEPHWDPPRTYGRTRPAMIFPLSPQDKESPSIGAYFEIANGFGAEPSFEVLARQKDPLLIIYIASCFEEVSSLNEPVIAGLQATPSMLVQQLERRALGTRPAVILDVPAVRTRSDELHQLLLRNYFAQMLLDSGMVNCVLGIGLRDAAATTQVHRILADEFESLKLSQAELLDYVSMHRSAPSQSDALFSRNPQHGLPGEARSYA